MKRSPNRAGLLFISIASASLAGVAAAFGTSTSDSARTLFIDVEKLPVGASSCGWCRNCLGGHDMGATGNYQYHDCIPTFCQDHPTCSGGDDPPCPDCGSAVTTKRLAFEGRAAGARSDGPAASTLGELWHAATEGDAESLGAVMRGYGPALYLNRARCSLQIRRCGQLVANVPLSPERVMLIAEILDE
jgi:hypothetical protein